MQIEVVGVKFKKNGNVYCFSPNGKEYKIGDKVIVESEKGNDIALVVEPAKLVAPSELTDGLKNILRLATNEDEQNSIKNNKIVAGYLKEIKKAIKDLQLDMKVISIESNYDLTRITINFTAEDRVDFRLLAKKLAEKYKARIDLRQVGPRDAVKIMGALGLCGKECCCSQGAGICDHVSIKMAKNQNLSLNPNSISGVCGKLLCCLSYENENYVEMLKKMPKINSIVETKEGTGKVIFNDLFKKTVSVKFDKDGVIEIKDFDLNDIKFEKRAIDKE